MLREMTLNSICGGSHSRLFSSSLFDLLLVLFGLPFSHFLGFIFWLSADTLLSSTSSVVVPLVHLGVADTKTPGHSSDLPRAPVRVQLILLLQNGDLFRVETRASILRCKSLHRATLVSLIGMRWFTLRSNLAWQRWALNRPDWWNHRKRR